MSVRHLSEIELVAYLDGELSGPERSSASVHLRHCPSCGRRLYHLEAARIEISRLRPVPSPADLQSRLATKLALQPVRSLRCREARRLIQELLDDAAVAVCGRRPPATPQRVRGLSRRIRLPPSYHAGAARPARVGGARKHLVHRLRGAVRSRRRPPGTSLGDRPWPRWRRPAWRCSWWAASASGLWLRCGQRPRYARLRRFAWRRSHRS